MMFLKPTNQVEGKIGDVIFTAGNKAKLAEVPQWNAEHGCWTAKAYKFFKHRQAFAKKPIRYDFLSYEIVSE